MLMQHEIDYIADRLIEHILPHLAARLDGPIRATIREEMKRMTDQALIDLSAATDAIVAELNLVVTTLEADAAALAAALANSGAANDPALVALTAKLTAGTKAASDAMAQLTPVSPASAPAQA